MRRVMVLGCSGSGKSTLGVRLGAALGVPVFHLDQLFHQAGWVRRPAPEFAADVARIAALPAWVIDGNFPAVAAARLAAADTIVYLDVPRRVCLARIVLRTLRYFGRRRPDSAEGCVERFDPAFFRWVWNWERDSGPNVRAMMAGFGGRVVTVRAEADACRLLANFDAPSHRSC